MSQKNILIIDDEDYIREMIIDFLEMENLKGIPVNSITDAEEKLKEIPFDLILTDINLGKERVEDLFEFMDQQRIKLPVILMTGDRNIDKKLLDNQFVAEVLHKPFQVKNFFTKIKTCLER